MNKSNINVDLVLDKQWLGDDSVTDKSWAGKAV